MRGNGSTQHKWTQYPASCFDASSTHNIWVKITAADLHALRYDRGFAGQNVYFHLNHPIRYVQLVGVVTSIDEKHPRLGIVAIDDGSGSILNVKINRLPPEIADSIDCPSNTEVDNLNVAAGIGKYAVEVDGQEIDVGTVLKVKGLISTFRDTRQLELKRVQVVKSTNEEAAFWAQTAAFKKDVLSRPWVLDQAKAAEQEMARQEAKRVKQVEKQAQREKWRVYNEKVRVIDEKREQRRRKRETMFNAGALPGSDVLIMPWDNNR